jgi:hypothetical protein
MVVALCNPGNPEALEDLRWCCRSFKQQQRNYAANEVPDSYKGNLETYSK